MPDCYRLLDIPPGSDEKTIRKAWRLKTKEVHPDVNASADAAVRFRELTQAMETLLDPNARLLHDRSYGYYNKPKNQDSNAKQQFSAFQEEKASKTVQEWSSDYDTAMAMREEQRRRHLARHRRNIRALWICIALFLLVVAAVVAWFALFDLPGQE